MTDRLAEIQANLTSGIYDTLPDVADYDMYWLIERVERLQERCEAYKGQVRAGSDEIERLRTNGLKVTGIPLKGKVR